MRTVLGDIESNQLGITDYHEHMFQVSPLLPGDELDDEERSGSEAQLLAGAGIDAMVDATPTALGRRPAALARISESSGLSIVATTGAHREAHYGRDHWLTDCSTEELTERFTADIVVGCETEDSHRATEIARTESGSPVRAGVLKVGIDYWNVNPFARRVIDAVGAAHALTGAPVMVHLEFGSAAFEVLECLDAAGVPADAIALAHIDRNPDPGLHADLARTGAYLGYDGIARSKSHPDSTILDCILAAAEGGAGERLLLGGDVARRTRYKSYGGIPGLAYLPERFLPRLREHVSADLFSRIMIENPARWLARFPIGA